MLVLTRKSGQEIVINGDIRLTFTVKGDKVKVGIDAPPHVRVDRDEVARQLHTAAAREVVLPHHTVGA